jgi:NAD(P)-dependent dehydrogenase (short-subunit alcohol dehydrogenase family)
MGRVDGKTAIVTGGALGIGKAAAERLAEEGAQVAVTDVKDDEGASVVDAIEADGGVARY